MVSSSGGIALAICRLPPSPPTVILSNAKNPSSRIAREALAVADGALLTMEWHMVAVVWA
jgi:hypothetical protein